MEKKDSRLQTNKTSQLYKYRAKGLAYYIMQHTQKVLWFENRIQIEILIPVYNRNQNKYNIPNIGTHLKFGEKVKMRVTINISTYVSFILYLRALDI